MSTAAPVRRGPTAPPEQAPPFIPPWMRMIAVVFLGQLAIQGTKNYASTGSVWPQSSPAIVNDRIDDSQSHISNSLETDATGISSAADLLPANAVPLWPLGTPLSIYVYLSTSPAGELDVPSYTSEALLSWHNISYGDWEERRVSDLTVDLGLPEYRNVLGENGTLWADIVTVAGGTKLGTDAVNEALRDSKKASTTRKMLTRFYPRRKIVKVKNLLQSKEDEDEAEDIEAAEPLTQEQPIVAHWAQNLTISLLSDGMTMPYGRQQGPIRDHIKLDRDGLRDHSGNGFYYPIVFVNDFWLLREDQYPINSTVTQLPLHVNLDTLGNFKFNIYASMQAASEAPKQSGMGGGIGDLDDMKRMLITANPYGLILTAVVTIFHMLFEFLAFSSDVKHWRKKDRDLVGVSLRSIITNVVIQLVIMLYLYDSSEETSMMILATQAFGLVIEVWKISKVVDVKINPTTPGAPLSLANLYGMSPYVISFEDKKQLSEDELKSQEYDRIAFRIVGYAAVPILAGYALYTLKYHSYKSWYSYSISTLAQAIYMFGFAQLVPQLIINYKLKSVAHIPLKAMIYKTLGTFVDDIFSFSVKMPALHRIACLRDDVIYFIMLYQMWIYRIDYTRANEYGQVATDGAVEPVDDKKVPRNHLKAD